MDAPTSLRRLVQTGAGVGAVGLGCLIADRGGPFDKPIAVACGAVGFAGVAHAALRRTAIRALAPAAHGPLDRVLLSWDTDNPLTVRDLLAGGVAVFGRTGSGKTSSSGKAIARAAVALPGSGGLILAAKPEDRAMWEGIFRAAGRADDLLVFGPGESLRFNFIGAEMAAGGHTRNIVRCITTIGETLRASNSTGGENADFAARFPSQVIFKGGTSLSKGWNLIGRFSAQTRRFEALERHGVEAEQIGGHVPVGVAGRAQALHDGVGQNLPEVPLQCRRVEAVRVVPCRVDGRVTLLERVQADACHLAEVPHGVGVRLPEVPLDVRLDRRPLQGVLRRQPVPVVAGR